MFESSDFEGAPPLDAEVWRAALRSHYGSDLEVGSHALRTWIRPFTVSGLSAASSRVQCEGGAFVIDSSAYRTERTQRDIRRDSMDNYAAVFAEAGCLVLSQNDQVIELAAGDVGLFDMSRPLTIISSSKAQRLTLILPRQTFVSHLGYEPPIGIYGRDSTKAKYMLHRLVRDAVEDEASQAPPARDFMRLAIYDLLGALTVPFVPLPLDNAEKLFARICSIIHARFADPDFGPSEVAAEAGISLRYLQKLFTVRGDTCVHYIQSLRLQHAARLLQRRLLFGRGQPLSEIAYASGFNDYPYFVRKFRKRFGYAPSAHTENRGRLAGTTMPSS